MTQRYEKSPYIPVNGRREFLLGVNYWSRVGGPRMWDRFDEDAVAAELRQMREIGLNTCRSFAYIPSIMPEPGNIDDAATAQLARFFEMCSEAGVSTIGTFLVGHMSGENYDFFGQGGRDLYRDAELMLWQTQVVRAVAEAGQDKDAVIAYLGSNEMPLWGGEAPPEVVREWAGRLRDALRSVDAKRPFGVGDGVMNLKGGQNGFDVDTLAEAVDFYGPHTYHADTDVLRQGYNAEMCLRSLSYTGKPVLFEEFGGSSCQVAEDHRALYYREVLASCLGVGACGALGWCFSDFDLENEPPYSHHAFELGFGVTRADGGEKPVCDELRAFRALVDSIGFAELETPRPRAAIVVPSYFNTTYPFSWEDRARMRRTLLSAYSLAASAGIETELVPESADLSRYDLLMAPSTQKLLAPTWRTLLERAHAGATVYWSYFGGDYNFHQGAWCHLIEELTGCEHRLRYGLADQPDTLTVLRGEGLDAEVRTDVSSPFARSYLPVDPIGAEVLASDQIGRPALLRAERGAGQVFFSPLPLEHYLAEQHGSETSSLHQVYALLARRSGLEHPISCDQPAVQRRLLRAGDATYLSLFNHDWRPLAAGIDAPAGELVSADDDAEAQALRGGAQQVALGPKQWRVYKLAECV